LEIDSAKSKDLIDFDAIFLIDFDAIDFDLQKAIFLLKQCYGESRHQHTD